MGWPLRCADCGTLFRVEDAKATCPRCDHPNSPYLYAIACPYCQKEDTMMLTWYPLYVDFAVPYVCEHCFKGIDGADWPYKPPDATDPLIDGGIWPYPSTPAP